MKVLQFNLNTNPDVMKFLVLPKKVASPGFMKTAITTSCVKFICHTIIDQFSRLKFFAHPPTDFPFTPTHEFLTSVHPEGEQLYPPPLTASTRSNQWNEDATQMQSCRIEVLQPCRVEEKANIGKENSILGLTNALYSSMSHGAVANPSGKLKENGTSYLDKARIISNSACQRSRRIRRASTPGYSLGNPTNGLRKMFVWHSERQVK